MVFKTVLSGKNKTWKITSTKNDSVYQLTAFDIKQKIGAQKIVFEIFTTIVCHVSFNFNIYGFITGITVSSKLRKSCLNQK